MFNNDEGTCIGEPNTKPSSCNKNKQRKRKKNSEEMRVYLSGPQSDEDDMERNKPKKIENKRRGSLQTSSKPEPLKRIRRRKSKTKAIDVNATEQAKEIQSRVISSLAKSEKFAHSSVNPSNPSIVERTEKSVEEVILASNSKIFDGPASDASMPILSPVLPAEATLEANLPSETSKLRSFGKLTQKENNIRLSASNAQKTCEQNQLQATSTLIQKTKKSRQQQVESVVVYQQANRSSQQQSALKRSFSIQHQSQHLTQQQESTSFDHQQSLNSRQEQLRQQQEKDAQQQTMLQTSVSLHQQQHAQGSLHLGEQQSVPVQNSNQQPVSIQTNQPQVNFAASHQFPSQPPQMMSVFTSSTTGSFQTISNSVCTDILLLQFNAYLKWFQNVRSFRETVGILSSNNVFKPSYLVFGKYCEQAMLEFGNDIIRAFLPFDVQRLNIAEIFTAVSKKLIENGHQIGTYVAVGIISYLIKPCEGICTTPFTKKFYHHLTTISDFLARSSASSRSQNVWSVVNLTRLEIQIQENHRITKWLRANMGRSSNENQETILKRTKQHHTTSVPSSAIQTVPSIQVQSHIVIAPSGHDKPWQQSQQKPNRIQQSSTTNRENGNNAQEISACAEQPETITDDDDVVDLTWIDEDETAEEMNDCKAFLFKVETNEEDLSSPVSGGSTQNQSSITNIENQNNAQEVSAYAEPLDSQQTTRRETTTDDFVDLTWIDEDETNEETQDCDAFLTDKAKSISLNSGRGSRHFLQNDDPGQSQKYCRLCSTKAIYMCRCQISMYCSRECQTKDWSVHQNFCKTVQSNTL